MKNISKKRLVLTAVISSVCSVAVVLLAVFLIFGNLGGTLIKLAQMNFLVNYSFFGETDDVDFDTGVCEGYVSKLDDKYAQYYPLEDSNEKFDAYEGMEIGIGISVSLNPDTGYFYVFRVNEGSPAAKAGIKVGDQISAVGEISVNLDTANDAIDALRGKIGDTVEVTVVSGVEQKSLEVEVSKFDVQSVYGEWIGDYYYIAITEFNDLTVQQFRLAIEEAVDGNAKGLIFDLMGNRGGTTDSVAEMIDLLVPEGDVLSVEYINGRTEVLHKSDDEEIDLPMAVIVDGNTASSAEIFAASIRDFDKGILIGQKTFGKGIMQKTYRLIDGSAVKFTVAKYFTKSGESYHNIGLVPDREVTLSKEQAKYFYMLDRAQNPYIQKAVEYLNEQ